MARLLLDCHKCRGEGVIWLPRFDARGALISGKHGAPLLWPHDCPRCDGTGAFTPKPDFRQGKKK